MVAPPYPLFDPSRCVFMQGVDANVRATAAGGSTRLSNLVEQGGKVPTPNLGADATPSGVVYVFHRAEEVGDGAAGK